MNATCVQMCGFAQKKEREREVCENARMQGVQFRERERELAKNLRAKETFLIFRD